MNVTSRPDTGPIEPASAVDRGLRPPLQPAPEVCPWLLLVHQLPARPSNLRVRTWRRMQQLGAIAVKQAVYVLPNSPAAREDFEWVKSEVESSGGQASIFVAARLDKFANDELVQEFRRAREGDYTELARAVERAVRAARRARAPRRSRRVAPRLVEMFRQRLRALEAIDYFSSAGRDRVILLMTELEEILNSRPVRSSSPPAPKSYEGRTWITRPRPGIDRMGSAWLIKRFIDPEARFEFADRPPSGGNGVPFDMFGVEFTHQGEWCTFETLAHTFAVPGAAVTRLAAIVHHLDLKDASTAPPEAGVVGAMVEGLQAVYSDDHTLLEQGMTMFEALYRSFERSDRPSGPRPVARRKRSGGRG